MMGSRTYQENPLHQLMCVTTPSYSQVAPRRGQRSKPTPSTHQIEAKEQKGNILIHDIWENGTDSVNYMHVVSTDTKSHSVKTPEKCLQEVERVKKKMYLEACLQKCRHFFLFITSVDRLLCVEAAATLKRISSRLSKKWQKP